MKSLRLILTILCWLLKYASRCFRSKTEISLMDLAAFREVPSRIRELYEICLICELFQQNIQIIKSDYRPCFDLSHIIMVVSKINGGCFVERSSFWLIEVSNESTRRGDYENFFGKIFFGTLYRLYGPSMDENSRSPRESFENTRYF